MYETVCGIILPLARLHAKIKQIYMAIDTKRNPHICICNAPINNIWLWSKRHVISIEFNNNRNNLTWRTSIKNKSSLHTTKCGTFFILTHMKCKRYILALFNIFFIITLSYSPGEICDSVFEKFYFRMTFDEQMKNYEIKWDITHCRLKDISL
jgi:hypothetical protein